MQLALSTSSLFLLSAVVWSVTAVICGWRFWRVVAARGAPAKAATEAFYTLTFAVIGAACAGIAYQ